jgi:hypothetical protein
VCEELETPPTGELLKLGISVSATTIANVLRSSGLGRHRRGLARPGLSSCAPKRAACSAAVCAPRWETTGSAVSPPSRAGRARTGRPASWKLTATSPRPMLPGPAWLLTRCQCGAVRRGRAFSLRLDDRCGCSHRIDHMRATDPKFGPALVPQPSAQARRQSIADRTRDRANHASNLSRGFHYLQPGGVGATDRPPARACQPELSFLPHRAQPGRTSVACPHPLEQARAVHEGFWD